MNQHKSWKYNRCAFDILENVQFHNSSQTLQSNNKIFSLEAVKPLP